MNPIMHDPGAAVRAGIFTDPSKTEGQFRDYRAGVRPEVQELYRLNHTNQTLDFVLAQKQKYGQLDHARMSVWDAMEKLNQIVDDSDPDTDLPQIEHALQTAEQIRRDGHPRWFILTGLIHDLGKVLCLLGEPQWAVVGDTFPVGCAFSDRIVFPEFFDANPDSKHPVYSTRLGIYEEGCGLDNVHLSWGHDEYLYYVTKDYLPPEALAMIRYHSCYPIHREGAYDYLLDEHDREMLEWVKKFNPYDLYTKSHEKPNFTELRPFYEELVGEFFPAELRW
ncbi:MAG: inositol oxygenase [Acidobacteria bacterium]|nr:inositol oxygenase [Acidobacteriota bacterium]MCW5970942.1 inositol oxygenase [Blastocatellales bacterium]